MIGCYPCVIVALILIHSHSTNQVKLDYSSVNIENDLHQEKPQYRGNMSLAHALAQTKPYDIVCDKLKVDEKKSLCDQAMILMINEYWSGQKVPGGSFVSFVDAKSTLDVPILANPKDPYTCKEVEAVFPHTTIKKDMYWCPHRPYRKVNSDEVHQQHGIFIMGSRLVFNKVYIFRPPNATIKVVRPVVKMESIEWFSKYAPGSSSSS